MSKKVKIYGCPGCGTEFTEREALYQDYLCVLCSSEEKLAYLGEFMTNELWEENHPEFNMEEL